MIKCGFVADPEILGVVEADPAAVLDPASPQLREVIERAIQVKIDVVVGDLKETGGADGHPGREVLNYGHTMAHAVEKGTGYRVRHGEAVALGHGLRRRARPPDRAPRRRRPPPGTRQVLASVGLPTRFAALPFEDALATMRVDKKSRGSVLRFVVLDGLAQPTVLADPAEQDLRASYDRAEGRCPR